MIDMIPMEKIALAEDNPRTKLGDLDELAQSIVAHGILEPLIVTPDGEGGYSLVIGHRRFAAADQAGLDVVPAIIREFEDDRTRREVMLVENLQRSDLDPLEEARAYSQLLALDRTQRDIAESIGRSQSHVSKRLSLLELPGEVLEEVDSGGINVGIALELVKLKDHPAELKEIIQSVKDDPEWMTADHVADEVESALKTIERDAKRVELEADLAAKRIPVTKKSSRPLAKNKWNGLGLNARAHAKEPCHAATINQFGVPEVTYVCTDPRRHGPDGESKLKSEALVEQPVQDRVAPEVDERRDRFKEIAAGRKAFVKELLSRKKLAIGDVLEFVLQDYIGTNVWSRPKCALELLGVQESFDQLSGYGKQGSQQLLKASLAKAIAGYEEYVEAGDAEEGADRYLRFLEARGYELSELERELVAECEGYAAEEEANP